MPRSLKSKKMLEKMEQLNRVKRQRRQQHQLPQPDGERINNNICFTYSCLFIPTSRSNTKKSTGKGVKG